MAELSKIRKNGVDYDIKDAVARKAIDDLELGGTVTDEQIASAVENYFAENPVTGGAKSSIFAGKTASFYGDSLTEANQHYSKGYHKWVSEILGLASYNNRGVSGYKVSDVYNRVNSVNDTADIIFVMCGVNDQNFSVPLGAMGDNTSDTTYGSLNLLCTLLKQKYPTKLVVFITPHYQTKYPHDEGITSYEVAKAVREVCEKYAIPVYDNFVLSGIYNTNLSTFTTDGCHWNNVGHEMVGKNLAQFMLNTFQYIHGNSSGGGTHTHSYTSTVTTAATCETDGVRTYTCSCGDSYTEKIPATGHGWGDGVVTVEPTETTQGVKTYTCTVCGETKTENIPALNHEHSYVSTVIAPTCTEQGYTEHECACGESYKDTYVPATGHSHTSEVTTEATCTTDGVRTYTCSACGDTYTETIPATGHNYVDDVCSVCGAENVRAVNVNATIKQVEMSGMTHIGFLVECPVGTSTNIRLECDIDDTAKLQNASVNCPFTYDSVDGFKTGAYKSIGSGKTATYEDNHVEMSVIYKSSQPYLAVFIPFNAGSLPLTVTFSNVFVYIDDVPKPILAVSTFKDNSNDAYAEFTVT